MLTEGRGVIEGKLSTEDIYVKVAEIFENCRCSRDFTVFKPYLAENVVCVIYGHKVLNGIDELEHYWVDREERASRGGLRIESSIRLCNYNCHASLYETIENYRPWIIMFRIEEGKVTHVVCACEPLQSPTYCKYDFDRLPLAYDYVMDNVAERLKGDSGRLPCMKCGALSEDLQWHKISIELNGNLYQGEVSVCRTCGKVIEFYPTEHKRIDVPAHECLIGEVVRQCPIIFDLEKREDEYIEKARTFFGCLSRMKSSEDGEGCGRVVELLDRLVFDDELCIQYAEHSGRSDYGEVSYLYFKGDEEYAIAATLPWDCVVQDQALFFRHIQAERSKESAWQIYLLASATYLLPTHWHGEYISREYILCEKDLSDVRGFHGERVFERMDISPIIENFSVRPCVELNGDVAHVTCCYWNNWTGLVKECVKIHFLPNGEVHVDEHVECEILYRYDCGIYL